jgi:3alpha(or 20beta)-hydroxysteroid dehydrogenase
VLLSDVSDAAGEAVAKSLGGPARYQHLDVASERDWAAAVGRARSEFGRIDALINNAAILVIKTLADTTREELLRLFEVNQLGPYLGMRAVLEPLREAGGGAIVNISSTDGLKGMNGVTAYASTKWAVRGMTRAAAIELARYRIRVNSICPEWGSAEMSAPWLPAGVDPHQAVEENANRLLPTPRGYTNVDRMRDVARTALFLVSDDCPTATGADFVVDGGVTAGYIQPGIAGA